MVGICGVHRLYLGQTGYGVVMLFTFGFLGIGQLLDLFLIPSAVNYANKSINDSGKAEQSGGSHRLNSPSKIQDKTWKTRVLKAEIVKDDELDVLLDQAKNSVERTSKEMIE